MNLPSLIKTCIGKKTLDLAVPDSGFGYLQSSWWKVCQKPHTVLTQESMTAQTATAEVSQTCDQGCGSSCM